MMKNTSHRTLADVKIKQVMQAVFVSCVNDWTEFGTIFFTKDTYIYTYTYV